MLNAVSIVCLLTIASLAALAVKSRHYDDSIAQCAGLGIVAVIGFVRAAQRITNGIEAPSLESVLILGGVTLYAVGTALRIWRGRRDYLARNPERRVQAHGRRGHAMRSGEWR